MNIINIIFIMLDVACRADIKFSMQNIRCC